MGVLSSGLAGAGHAAVATEVTEVVPGNCAEVQAANSVRPNRQAERAVDKGWLGVGVMVGFRQG